MKNIACMPRFHVQSVWKHREYQFDLNILKVG